MSINCKPPHPVAEDEAADHQKAVIMKGIFILLPFCELCKEVSMATARKLPSGSWRVRVYDGVIDGKAHYTSITGATKKEAESKAARYLDNSSARKGRSITVSDAIERYITAKSKVLSPSTIRGYRQMQGRHYDSIARKDIYKLDSEDMQIFISSLTGSLSAKTVSNAYGLLVSSIAMFRPDAVFRVTLPKKIKAKSKSPTDADIKALFNAAPDDLKLCIALAAFGSLRRGEICALKHGDVSGCSVHVHADMVENEKNKFEYKEIPKTSDSVRTVLLPPQILALMPDGGKDEYLVGRTPNAVTHAFTRLRNRIGIDVRFHDLRHYFASIGAVLGVPDTYLSDFGGWRRGSAVMKEVYQGTMKDVSDEYAVTMARHFGRMISQEK